MVRAADMPLFTAPVFVQHCWALSIPVPPAGDLCAEQHSTASSRPSFACFAIDVVASQSSPVRWFR